MRKSSWIAAKFQLTLPSEAACFAFWNPHFHHTAIHTSGHVMEEFLQKLTMSKNSVRQCCLSSAEQKEVETISLPYICFNVRLRMKLEKFRLSLSTSAFHLPSYCSPAFDASFAQKSPPRLLPFVSCTLAFFAFFTLPLFCLLLLWKPIKLRAIFVSPILYRSLSLLLASSWMENVGVYPPPLSLSLCRVIHQGSASVSDGSSSLTWRWKNAPCLGKIFLNYEDKMNSFYRVFQHSPTYSFSATGQMIG